MPNDGTASSEEIPDHMIVILDPTIGKPEEYQHLKAAFSSTTDPQNECPIKLIDKDYDEMIRTTGPKSIKFEGVKFSLAAFTNAELCVEFLKENQNKRIFLIISGQMGRATVRSIMHNCRNVFIDQVTNEPYQSIYVFCHGIDRNIDWMVDYLDYLAPAFTFDADLLVRLIRDIAHNFVVESKRLLNANPPNNLAAYHRLNWAHELYQRYSELEKVVSEKEFDEVNALLAPLELAMKQSRNNEG